MMYHVSFDRVTEVIPKIQKNICPGEDATIPHICAAPTIGQALNAVPQAGFVASYMRELGLPVILHVYALTGDRLMENHKVQQHVPDAELSGEVWLLEKPASVKRTDYEITDFDTKIFIDVNGNEICCIYNLKARVCAYSSNRENFINEFRPSNRKRFLELFEKYGYRTVIFNIGEDLIQKRQAQALEEMELY